MEKRLKSAVFAVLVVWGSMVVSAIIGFFVPVFKTIPERIDNIFYDLAMKKFVKQEESVKDIVLVAITPECLDYYRKKLIGWPWPREFYSYIVDYCKEGGAKALFIDLIFTDYSQRSDDDNVFSQRLLTWQHIFTVGEFEEEIKEFERPDPKFIEKFSIQLIDRYSGLKPRTSAIVRLPINEISENVQGVCDVSTNSDIDGIIRRYPLFSRYSERYFPSAALALISHIGGINSVTVEDQMLKAGRHNIPVDQEGNMRLKFYGKFGVFKMVKASSIIQSAYVKSEGEQPEIPPDIFKDKVVFVGVNFPGLDLRNTSVERQLPGVFIHATAVANILANDFLRVVPKTYIFIMVLLYVPISCFIFRYVKPFFLRFCFPGFIILHGLLAEYLFQKNLWIMVSPQWMAILSSYISTLLASYIYEGRQKAFIRKTFQAYVSPAVVDKILGRADALHMFGERKTLTVMMLDLEGFTTVAEGLEPAEAVTLLNKYFNITAEQIFKYEGTLDKFIGDAVMCFWGDPAEQADHATKACYCALAIQDAFKQMDVKARIGINTGEVIAGAMGSDNLHNYTVIGDEVNLASRLEAVNKAFNTRILISSRTYGAVQDQVHVREIGLVRVKGRHKAERLYELLGLKSEPFGDFLKVYNEALGYFKAGEYSRAKDAFREAGHALDHEDKMCNLYISLCDQFISGRGIPAGEYVHELLEK